VAETTIKILLRCGFWRTGKTMGQVYHCWWRICRKINVLSRFECHMFYYVLYPFVSYLLTVPRISDSWTVKSTTVFWGYGTMEGSGHGLCIWAFVSRD
jgi:hypothetical protein